MKKCKDCINYTECEVNWCNIYGHLVEMDRDKELEIEYENCMDYEEDTQMKKIKGFNITISEIQGDIKEIEQIVGRKLNTEQITEVATLWNWGYEIDECADMIQRNITALQYDNL